MSTPAPHHLGTTQRLARVPVQQRRVSAPPTRPASPRGMIAAWIATIALVVGLLIALATLGSGRSTSDVLAHDLDARFTYTVTHEALGFRDGALSVVLTNTSTEQRSFAFTVQAVGKDGANLGTDTGSVENLPAGRPALVELFIGRSSDQMAALKDATFQIVHASAK